MQCNAVQFMPVLFEVVVTTPITTPIATPGTQEPPFKSKSINWRRLVGRVQRVLAVGEIQF